MFIGETGIREMWLSPECLAWSAYVQDSSGIDEQDRERAYEIWAHSERILDQYSDNLHLVDAVTTLKRAMFHRVRLLRDTYRFDTIPVVSNSKRAIEQLAYWGIVRPTMLARLLEIRNAVEHEDASPPPRETCVELLDFVWYFLRSTDALATSYPTKIVFDSEPYTVNTHFLELKVSPEDNWGLDFRCWIGASMLLECKQNRWLETQVNRRDTRDEVRSRLSDPTFHENRKEDDLFVQGTIVGPESQLERIFRLYFRLALTGN